VSLARRREPVRPERYVRLGLQLGRHVDGLVDAYFGPPELAGEYERRVVGCFDGALLEVRSLSQSLSCLEPVGSLSHGGSRD
jgi:hypothetical protein